MYQAVQERISSIANDLKVECGQVEAAIRLLDLNNTIPFIAHYRKEMTGGLNTFQLRFINEYRCQLNELNMRRSKILNVLQAQGHLTPALKAKIEAAQSKTVLEDLYAPYRSKRQTKAQLAKEAGLAPLAAMLSKHTEPVLLSEAAKFISPEHNIHDEKAALEGAKQILMESFLEEAELIEALRTVLWRHAKVKTSKGRNQKQAVAKYAGYFEYQMLLHKISAPQALTLFRGRREEALKLELVLEDQSASFKMIAEHFNVTLEESTPFFEIIQRAWKAKLWPRLECEAFSRLKELADDEALRMLSRNFNDLLLTPAAGQRIVMGFECGRKVGINLAVVDRVGQVKAVSTVFPFTPPYAKEDAIIEIAKLAIRHEVELFAIGHGAASRETEQLVVEVMKRYSDLTCSRIIVSEAGAAAYAVSEIAAEENPDIDVAVRGAVSIARRLQNPLKEFVKIDPKSISVGQYQQDVNPVKLERSLNGIIEDCVNSVTVDVNTASFSLLTKVAGLNEMVVKQILDCRHERGAFTSREQLKTIPDMTPEIFEQAAGFLSIQDGEIRLDATRIHPERYGIVEKMLQDHELSLDKAMGNTEGLQSITLTAYTNETCGLPTLRDIIVELDKPGRDPRPVFRIPKFMPGIEQLSSLKVGMILEGVVSRISPFGAFVNIGVNQDGLIHVSEMPKRRVSTHENRVKVGEVIRVKVIEVDSVRRRIGLSMNCEVERKPVQTKKVVSKPKVSKRPVVKAPLNTAMADALEKWKEKHS